MQNYVMLKRNLLYTAVTRAEQNLVLIGDPRAYELAFNTSGNDRQTGLTVKLQKILNVQDKTVPEKDSGKNKNDQGETNSDVLEDPTQDFILTPELIYSGQIDPLIGMKDTKLETRTR